MNGPGNQLPPEPQLVISQRGKRLRPVTSRQVIELQQWEIDFRFVREVERLERDGLIPNRGSLERSLGMRAGEISAIRSGLRGINPVHIAILFEKYRGDRDFILHGQRNQELSRPYIPGIGNIAKYEGFIHHYTSPAKWRCGPRPETLIPTPGKPNEPLVAMHYPEDPKNEQWSPPKLKSIADFKVETAPTE